MAFDQAKFLARFLEEAREQCARINSGILELERNPNDAEIMNSLFRAAHTIKGSSRMIKQLSVAEVAHKIEDLLDALRSGKIGFSRGFSDILFRGVDVVSDMLEKIASGCEPGEPPANICLELERAAGGELGALGEKPGATNNAPFVSAASVEEAVEVSPASPEPVTQVVKSRGERLAKVETIRIDTVKLDTLIKLMGEIVSAHGRARRSLALISELEKLSGKAADVAFDNCSSGGKDYDGKVEIQRTFHSLKGALSALSACSRDDSLHMGQLIEELQDISLAMRLLPLSTVFDAFPRTVRDLSNAIGKEIEFIVEGGETEMDKKIIEQIGDPLLHMIRNAVDHGIEDVEERLKSGKPKRGTLHLSACYEGGSVTIALRDDGRGISLTKIREKALQKKLVSEDSLAKMSESGILDLIFLPGFSTNPIITDLSGRGVGMDVVRKNVVEELKGTIRIETREGLGSAFYLKLPLNLAVFRLLFVVVDNRTFALPATAVNEIVAVPRKEIIDVVNRKAFRLREQIIPVEELGLLLGLPDSGKTANGTATIAIVSTGNERLGLIIDELLTEADMVVKPLPSHMKNVRLVSGLAVGSGNEIICVLQAPALLNRAREMKEGRLVKPVAEKRQISILVVDDSINTRDIEKSILEAYGYDVDLAEDGMVAFEKTKLKQYDAIVTDVEMPLLDGFSLTERLRQEERYAETPIIIVTSLEKESDKRRGIAVGANAYIVKGTFEQSNLLETVQNLVG